ncbi:hypothetical protein [Rhodobacter sp. 24-YEA-8]|uniref:hypothetical protein n=1 Tax=Rhodobacter sp. 24-YEA-8 TaxID=1884310 RepID=UPI00089D4045|nr:hypothetical protein [Rhodobacter sp. 24-YEA-8]SEB80086.1 hypothetical protein SAMN05519105_1336 [Rhodobacter sp. 24-YEA-8]
MSEIRITIACPVAHLADAAQFSRATGYGPEDEHTFTIAPEYQDMAGNRYRVASGLVAGVYLTNAVSPLIAPAWGADVAAADRAQALIAVWQPPEDPEALPEPFAAPDRIAAVIGDDPQAALAVLGLTAAIL